MQGTYRIASFVGNSTSSKRKMSIADLVDIRDQQADLEAFRSGAKNLMICTSVLEEGIDVTSCNLVVCFELPTNLVSFVQRRGRARKSGSKYILFVSNDDEKKQNKPWEVLEAQMRQKYMDETRQLKEIVEDDSILSDRLYRVEATGAVLTLENAKAHLYHFCSVGNIDASPYGDLQPEFDVVEDSMSKLWTATVDLPSFVHTSVRQATSLKGWGSEDLAVKDAAFEACVALHENGLLNDNLLPLTKEYASETGQHLDQPSIVPVSDRKPSFATVTHASWWYSVSINTGLADENLVDMVMWTQFLPPSLDDIVLYWNQELTYTIQLQYSTVTRVDMSAEQLENLRQSTKLLLRSVHATRISTEASDFPILFAPAGVSDLSEWLQEVRGMQTFQLFARASDIDNAGLVRVSSQVGRTFVLYTKKGETLSETQSDQLTVLRFPKRKDFLHPIPLDSNANSAYTTVQSFSKGECTVDMLPAKYAIFAAFIPSIMHCIDTASLAAELNSTILQNVQISNTSLVLEAISSPAASEVSDYNRLEYLGDTCLKHCTELQVMAQHPTWPELRKREQLRVSEPLACELSPIFAVAGFPPAIEKELGGYAAVMPRCPYRKN